MRLPGVLFGALLALVGAAWFLLAIACFVYPVLPIRLVLGLLTGLIFVAGFVWYAAASWQWRRSSVGLDHLARPATLFLFGWLLCLGSALASGFALKIEAQPASPSTPQTTMKPKTTS